MKLRDLALALCMEADDDREIMGINSPELACEDEIAFLNDEKYTKSAADSRAGAFFVRRELADSVRKEAFKLITDDPYMMMAKASAIFAEAPVKNAGKAAEIGENTQVMEFVRIGRDTVIGKNCVIMSGAYIGDDVTIGDECVIYPNVTLFNKTVLKNRVRLHGGVVIGGDGFGYRHIKTGEHIKIHHFGRVVLEDDVEVGANSTIDRALFGETVIKRGTKIDNLVHIAHNCIVGEHSILVAQSGIAGSTTIGRNFVAGGQSATSGHLKIGDFVTVAARSGITKNLPDGGTYSGFPLMDHKKWLRLQAKIAGLLKK
ncbi:MAG: UDP-3-O-(3-hydroxymyristoyl)glucosamine N-acyltransferase [Helicobacteraceae bacterium]|jgi:UDP-3-O-[3-hydroxymyristoyl] glucosamine N-acyltransferase|nr:UDP-3-O-(3-hydroxymyristoyl)glucosamine N-acyltransferase [Helicobacteraceae bacterium]